MLQQDDASTQAQLSTSTAHTIYEDAYALVAGLLFIVLGLVFLKGAGIVTGGIAGIALLLSYAFGAPVGTIMAVINLPFLGFAYFTMGRAFAVKTLALNCGIAIVMSVMPQAVHLVHVQPAFAAFAGGTLCGMGVLALARHGAGVGGVGVMVLWLQKHKGINPGHSQFVIDALILLCSLLFLSLEQFAWSIFGAIASNAMLVAWHRQDRYVGH